MSSRAGNRILPLMKMAGARIALELLEYKIEDLRKRRPVRGGVAAVRLLQEHIETLTDQFESDELARFRALGRELGVRQDDVMPAQLSDDPAVRFDQLVLGNDTQVGRRPIRNAIANPDDEPMFAVPAETDDDVLLLSGPEPSASLTPAERREQEALQRLAHRVFSRDVDRFAEGVAATWRAERERATARLMFATLRNLQHYRELPGFPRDVNLRQFKVVESIPPRIDPLVSLSDTGSLSVIARDVVEAVLRLRDIDPAPQIERRDSLDYLRRVALEVAGDPWAGQRSAVPHRGPSSSELRAALRDLARERLPAWQRQARRQDLEARLQERSDLDRQQRTMLRSDTMRFTELVGTFFDRLARLVPQSVGGVAAEPQLSGGILFAAAPAFRRSDVPKDARSLTVRLAGPVRLTFLGTELAVTTQGASRHLFLGGDEIPLDGDRAVPFGDHELEVFVEGQYLHLRLRETGGSLAARTAEAAAALHVLTSRGRDGQLALLRLLAPGASAEPAKLVIEALHRAGQITSKAPNRRDALLGLLRGAAQALGSDLPDAWTQGFVARAQLALSARPDQLEEALTMLTSADVAADAPIVIPFGGDPVDVSVGGRIITVRRYGQQSDHLVAMLPGQVIGAFSDHLIESLGTGTLVCIQGQQQLVVAFLPGTRIAVRAKV